MRRRSLERFGVPFLAVVAGLAACGGAESAGDEASVPIRERAVQPAWEPVAIRPEVAELPAPDRGEVTAQAAAGVPESGRSRGTVEQPAREQPAPAPALGGEASAGAKPSVAPNRDTRLETIRPEPLRLDAGALVVLRLRQMLSTRTSRVGDVFYAELAEDILDARGTVLVLMGATVRGRVTDVRRSEGADDDALLALSFEALMVDGRTYPIRATVVEAAPETTRGDSELESAAKIATGTAAGALIGRILGKKKEATVVGGVVGAAAGTAVALSTRHGDATLREGSSIVIRLHEPVLLAAP